MKTTTLWWMGIVLLTGCNGTQNSAPARKVARGPKPATEPTAAGQAFRLHEEPIGAKDVLVVKKDAKDGDEVIVIGRIGGSPKPFTGRAAFTIVDASLKSCNENAEDDCPTPWDYCCVGKDDLTKATALIKLVGDDGQTLADDARAMLGLTELQTVVVRGKAKRDDAGNLTIHLNGVFVRPGKGAS
jgi:hypothetical protein